MKIKQTNIKGCFVIEPNVFQDKRGYFLESYNHSLFNEISGLNVNFVQDNESYSLKGVLRGLHYQIGDLAQAKLVRVIKGKVLDVAVDIRKDSRTYGKYVAVELSEKNKKLFFVPRGFAHGFIVLSESAIFSYKCDNYYNKEAERGIIYNDVQLGIDWILPKEELNISEKDLRLTNFKSISF